jgi:aarF domain-containing kinase
MKAVRRFCSSAGAAAGAAPQHTAAGGGFKRYLKIGSVVVVVAGAAGYAYRYATDEGTRRSATFWRISGPIYAHYRLVQLLNKDLGILPDSIADPYYLKLHEKYAPAARDITYTLRGFYMKNAQLLSCQDGFMPEAYMSWMKDTQDNVPSEFEGQGAREYCRQKLKEELGLEFDEVFEWWDDQPIGVASIGEVHRARLRRSGQDVAVKLQFPDMERRFRADIKTIREFCDLAMPQFSGSFNEVEKQFATEFDYRGEARNLTEIRAVIEPKYGKYVEIPKAHPELCSKHVLVMDFLRGKKLVDGVRDHFRGVAKLLNTTLEALEADQKREIEEGTFRFKSLQEEQTQAEKLRWLMWLKDVTSYTNVSRFLYNNLSPLPFVYPRPDSSAGYLPYEWTEPALNLGKLLEMMAVVHAHELFVIGAFNGDPHPGNILLLEDGRLGLIDYGE